MSRQNTPKTSCNSTKIHSPPFPLLPLLPSLLIQPPLLLPPSIPLPLPLPTVQQLQTPRPLTQHLLRLRDQTRRKLLYILIRKKPKALHRYTGSSLSCLKKANAITNLRNLPPFHQLLLPRRDDTRAFFEFRFLDAAAAWFSTTQRTDCCQPSITISFHFSFCCRGLCFRLRNCRYLEMRRHECKGKKVGKYSTT